MEIRFILFVNLLIVYYIFLSKYIINNSYSIIWKKFVHINSLRYKTAIFFYPFIGCGFANKITALVSSFLLSFLSSYPVYIIKWYDLLYYYRLPRSMFLQVSYINQLVTFNRKNTTILTLLNKNISIKIYTYHSFISSVVLRYNLTKDLINIVKKESNKGIRLESFLHNIFLRPSNHIIENINKFIKIKMNLYTIGIHIRTGYLSDFGEKDFRFFNNNSIATYYNKINSLLLDNKYSKLLIISDSSVIRRQFIEKYNKYILNFTIHGNICHARYSMHGKAKENECVVKLISENYILSYCNILIGSKKSSYFSLACMRSNVKCIKV